MKRDGTNGIEVPAAGDNGQELFPLAVSNIVNRDELDVIHTASDTSYLNVFYVHSAITYLLALAVIEYLDLASDNVLIVFARGFRIETNLPSLTYPFPIGQNYFCQVRKPITFLVRAREFKKFIDTLAGNSPMNWYLPQTSLSMFQLLRTDWRFRSFSLIEEGNANYSRDRRFSEPTSRLLRDTSNFARVRAAVGRAYRTLLGKALVSRRWTDSRTFFEPGYRQCFVVSRAAMHDYPRRVVLDLRESGRIKNLCCNYSTCLPVGPDIYVLAFDASVEFGLITEELFWSFWRTVRQYLDEKGVHRLFVKRHPYQVIEDGFWRKFIESVSKDSTAPELYVLPDDAILEIEFLKNPSITLVTSGSSLIMYARTFGAAVATFPIAARTASVG